MAVSKTTDNNPVTDKEIAAAARTLFQLIAMQSPTVAKVAKDTAPVEDDDVEDVEDEDEELDELDEAEVSAMSIKDLRVLAKKYGVASIKKSEILEGLAEFFADSDEDEADDEDADDDEDDDEGLTREDLEEMDLKELRVIAKANGVATRGLDQDALVDAIMGDEDEDDDDEADDDEDVEDVDDEDDDEDVEEIDEESLKAMPLTELRALAKEIDVKVKIPVTAKTNAAKQKVYVAAILNSGSE